MIKSTFNIIIALHIVLFYVLNVNCEENDTKIDIKLENITEDNIISSTNFTMFSSGDKTDFQTIKFGENIVNVYDTNEVTHDDGSVSKRLSLANGIFFDINSVPNKENGTEFFTIFGRFEFRTPDGSYSVEFKADPKNFTLLNFVKTDTIVLSANPKLLAALAGR